MASQSRARSARPERKAKRARDKGGVRLRARREGADAADGETRARDRGCEPPRGGRARRGDLPRVRAPGGGRVIARLRGQRAGLSGAGLVLDVNGVGYLVQATPSVLPPRSADLT